MNNGDIRQYMTADGMDAFRHAARHVYMDKDFGDDLTNLMVGLARGAPKDKMASIWNAIDWTRVTRNPASVTLPPDAQFTKTNEYATLTTMLDHGKAQWPLLNNQGRYLMLQSIRAKLADCMMDEKAKGLADWLASGE